MRWALALLVIAGCSEGSVTEPEPSPSPSSSSTAQAPPSAGVDAGPAHAPSAALKRCAASPTEPASIADGVALLNALAPADGPCFVAALRRPLSVVATRGVTSAQPAASKSSPRLFFLLPKVAISAVPEGEGGKLLEFGQWTSATQTLKGEIALPVTTPLAPDAPFKKVLQDPYRTVCGTCHRGEHGHPSIPGAFISAAFKPEPGTFVTVAELAEHHAACAQSADPSPRCEMFHALFDFGAVTQGAFAPEVETFFTTP